MNKPARYPQESHTWTHASRGIRVIDHIAAIPVRTRPSRLYHTEHGMPSPAESTATVLSAGNDFPSPTSQAYICEHGFHAQTGKPTRKVVPGRHRRKTRATEQGAEYASYRSRSIRILTSNMVPMRSMIQFTMGLARTHSTGTMCSGADGATFSPVGKTDG